jgi:predicted Zn-dependent protease
MIIKLPSKILVGIFKNTIYALIVSVIFSGYLHPQNLRYFENYQPLQAMGEMPDEFIEYSFSKVSRDFQNLEADDLTARERRDFIKGVHYGIDQLIHSGIVLYGDPISQYVTKVGEQLISNEPGLSHLRFYTFRSNIVNAFSTHQGIIFVSQGLIAQVENEAQLAFILAHEIAHYIEKHVIQNYIDVVDLSKSRSSNDSKLKQLSQYSREKEFEADEIGIEIYHKAGYTKKNLYGMFDVLAYSYLPFDLKDIPNDY